MSIKAHPSIKPDLQAKLLAMSDAELVHEIALAPYSLRPMTIPYMKAILAERQAIREAEHNEQMLREARRSNVASSRANWIAILALIVSCVALAVSLVQGS